MFGRGLWIAAGGMLVAVVIWILLATRGPASSRAPVQGAAPGAPEETVAVSDGAAAIRASITVHPAGGTPDWMVEVRDSRGALHTERGTSAGERVIASVSPGRVMCVIRAPGFLGETRRLEVARGREAAVPLSLRQLGHVSGTVRCDGVPVAGVLVRLAVPEDAASVLMNMVPEDRAAGMARSVESDSDGRYRFDRVPPVSGVTLVAAAFDYPPVRVGPVAVPAGKEVTADFAMVLGTHLAGRIVDLRGAPCAGATVNVLHLHEGRSVIRWEDEARARTDEDGRFVTPALAGPAMRMLKTWIAVDGVQQVIQHEASPPDRGTKDVGTLAPHPGTVQFELEAAPGDALPSLTVAVNGDPQGAGQTIVLTGVAFDPDGKVRLAGLPAGEGVYSAVGSDSVATADGQFRTTGRDMIVKIPPLRLPEERPAPAEQLIVDVPEMTEPGLLLLVADGDFVLWRQIEKGVSEPVVETVAPGPYSLLVVSGHRFARKDITQVEGQDLRVSIVPEQLGRELSVRVLDDGKPVCGANVFIRGFRSRSNGLNAPWAETGSDGRALLRGIPPDVNALTILAFAEDGFGRAVSLDVAGVDETTVDLAKSPSGD